MKQWKAVLTGMLCLACLSAPLTASAEYIEYELKSERFTYTQLRNHLGEMNTYLESDMADINFIVIGKYYLDSYDKPCYCVRMLNDAVYGDGSSYNLHILGQNDQTELFVGDLLYIEDYSVAEILPPDVDCSTFTVVGNGAELFGEDFKQVLRREMDEFDLDSPESFFGYGRTGRWDTTTPLVDKGDVNDDGSISIMDVIAVNKYLLNVGTLSYYGSFAADTDNSCEVDPTDSLNILKYIVGITDTVSVNN